MHKWRMIVKNKLAMEMHNREHMIALRFGRLVKKAMIMPLLMQSMQRSLRFKMIARKMLKRHNQLAALTEHAQSKQKELLKEQQKE